MRLPPLVDPIAELSRAEVTRYVRHITIPDIGMVGQKRLKNSKVLVVGAGGLGSPTLMYLAAAGVGTIGIVDFDVVDESNLQRQVIHGQSDIGLSKAVSAKNSILEINPLITVKIYEFALDKANAVELFEQYDLVVDGGDNFATSYLINDASILAKKPYVWGAINCIEGQVSVFWEDAPYGSGLNYRDLYPQPPPSWMVPSCTESGVLGLLCAMIGSVMGTEAIKLICGIGETLLGRLIIYNALEMKFRTMKIVKDPTGKKITTLIDYNDFCGVASSRPQVSTSGSTLTPAELQNSIASGTPLALIDVREPVEWDFSHIPGATLIPKNEFVSGEALLKIPRDRLVVLYCLTGVRSSEVLTLLEGAGIMYATYLKGGIRAWANTVDPSMTILDA